MRTTPSLPSAIKRRTVRSLTLRSAATSLAVRNGWRCWSEGVRMALLASRRISVGIAAHNFLGCLPGKQENQRKQGRVRRKERIARQDVGGIACEVGSGRRVETGHAVEDWNSSDANHPQNPTMTREGF